MGIFHVFKLYKWYQITQRITYFEPGHTFVLEDSFHHKVEQGMTKKAS